MAKPSNKACRNAVIFISLFGGEGDAIYRTAVLEKGRKMGFASDLSV